MSLLQEFKGQFEEKYRDIVSSEFNGAFEIEDQDLEDCFESVMLDDEFSEVDSEVNKGIIEWIEYHKEDEFDRETRIERLHDKIADLEAELDSYQSELSALENELPEDNSTANTTNETWDSLSKSDRW